MQITIDSAGRLVIPKTLRDALGLLAGRPLELELRDDHLEISAAPTTMRLEGAGAGLTAVPDAPLPPLTGDEVRTTLERGRR